MSNLASTIQEPVIEAYLILINILLNKFNFLRRYKDFKCHAPIITIKGAI